MCSRGFGMDSGVCPFVFQPSECAMIVSPRMLAKIARLTERKDFREYYLEIPCVLFFRASFCLESVFNFISNVLRQKLTLWLDDWGLTPTHQNVLGVSGWSSLLPYAHVRFSSPLDITGGHVSRETRYRGTLL